MFARFSLLLVAFGLLVSLSACGIDTDIEDIDSPGTGMARIARHLKERGEVGPAIDFYRRSLAIDPKNPMAIKGLAGVLEEWGDRSAAADIYRDGIARLPKDGELRRSYGKLLIVLDRPAEAREQFLAALDIDSSDLKARSGLGVSLDYLGEHLKAQQEYERVLEREPSNLATINNLAYSYILVRRYDKAIKLLEPQANKPSATAALRQNLALAYGLSGMDVDAERVARMDLTPDKVAENMAYYRRQRAEIKVSNAPYAELGTYATEAMAVAQIQRLQADIDKVGGKLKPVVLPEVSGPGGTPRFAVRMMGCSRPSDVDRLCNLLAASGVPCVPRGKGAAME